MPCFSLSFDLVSEIAAIIVFIRRLLVVQDPLSTPFFSSRSQKNYILPPHLLPSFTNLYSVVLPDRDNVAPRHFQ